MKTISVNNESYERFKLVREKRPQDDNNAQTFGYILYVYEEQQLKPSHERGVIPEILKERLAEKTLAPVIDAEKPRSAEELRKLAPTRNNTFVQIGDVKKP